MTFARGLVDAQGEITDALPDRLCAALRAPPTRTGGRRGVSVAPAHGQRAVVRPEQPGCAAGLCPTPDPSEDRYCADWTQSHPHADCTIPRASARGNWW